MMLITYNFSEAKNRELIKERRISFEEIISAIANNSIIAIVEHHNLQRYPNQQMYIIEFNCYAYLIPFIVQDSYAYLIPFIVQDSGEIFLKTIIPSRKATKKYLKE